MRMSALPQRRRFDARDASDSGRAVWDQEVVQPGATRTGLVGEVPEHRHRDDSHTPQRCYDEPHVVLHHRPESSWLDQDMGPTNTVDLTR